MWTSSRMHRSKMRFRTTALFNTQMDSRGDMLFTNQSSQYLTISQLCMIQLALLAHTSESVAANVFESGA
jgi:hypothetical protein